MKNLKKNFTSGLIAISLMTGAVTVPSNNANAAVIIGIGVPGIGSSLVGLGMFMFSVTFGISLNIHPGIIAAICLLDDNLNEDGIRKIESKLRDVYNMDNASISSTIDYLKFNFQSNDVRTYSNGSKAIALNENQFNDVINNSQTVMSAEKLANLKSLLTYVPTESEANQIREEISKLNEAAK